MARSELIVGLDIGTTKICVVVGELSPEGVDVVGIGTSPSTGLRKGVVVNIEQTVQSIKKALEEAELMIVSAARGDGLRRALAAWDGDIGWYLDRERPADETLPWEMIDVGVSRQVLWREWQRYRQGLGTAKCPPAGCAACGRCDAAR